MRSTTRSTIMCLILSLTILFLPLNSLATNVGDSLVVSIQLVKTPLIRPLEPNDRDILSVYDLVYESLVSIDDNYLPQPCLCRSWEQSSNAKTWTFRLREDVVFSDGTPFSAYDVVATANAILDRAADENNANKGFYANLSYFISSISASDAYTVTVKTQRPYYGLLYAMTFPILPADRVSSDNPPGTGPYVIDTFTPDYITLSVNSQWWKNKPVVTQIAFRVNDTPKSVIEDYDYARVDAAFTRSISASQYRSSTTAFAIDYRTNQLDCLLMNHSAERLANANVRKAIRYAIDVDRIARNIYMGMCTRTDTPAIPGTWLYNDNLSQYFVTNVDEAKRLLAEEGWDDSNEDGVLDRLGDDGSLVELKMNLYVYEEPENDVRIETANYIKEALAEIGIAVTITTMTFTGIQEKLKAGAFNLALVSYAMDVCPDYGFMLMSGNTGNYCRYRSTRMTDLCKELRTCTTMTEYQQKMMQIQQVFAEDCPFICMFYREGVVLTRMMYTTVRDVREYELLRGIESFRP
ncbi:MAG: hypothetical protein IJ229_06950 [Clostridia bacterium]|nr:hypothetical protein [Clostridia bacterium]